jgi:hypothetical protein
MRKVLLVAIGVASLASALMAQGEPPSQVWGQRSAAAIRSSFPGAQLQPRRVSPRSQLRRVLSRGDRQIWDYRGEKISLTFTELEFEMEASKFLKMRTERLPAGSRPVGVFGDEALLLSPGVSAQRYMNLRRRNVVLEIGAPGEIALSRLALALVEVVDKVVSK